MAPFGAGGGVVGTTELIAAKSGKIGAWLGKLFGKEEVAEEAILFKNKFPTDMIDGKRLPSDVLSGLVISSMMASHRWEAA